MEALGITGAVIVIIISLIPLIVFFVMASNIATIKHELTILKDLIIMGDYQHWYWGNRELFKGNKEKALDYFMNYLWYVQGHESRVIRGLTREQTMEKLRELITSLGGKFPGETE